MIFKIPLVRYRDTDFDYFSTSVLVTVEETRGGGIKLVEQCSGNTLYIRNIPSAFSHQMCGIDTLKTMIGEQLVGYADEDDMMFYVENYISRSEYLDSLNGANYINSRGIDIIQTEINKRMNENKGDNKNMNLTTSLKDKLCYGWAPKSFSLSMDGKVAFKGQTYDPEGKVLNDTLGLTLDLPLMIIPQNKIEAGDIVYNKVEDKAYYFDGTSYIDYTNGQIANFVPTKVFNMSFYSVVKNTMSGIANGNMNNLLPLLLLKDGNLNMKDNDMFLMFAMMNGGFNLFGNNK